MQEGAGNQIARGEVGVLARAEAEGIKGGRGNSHAAGPGKLYAVLVHIGERGTLRYESAGRNEGIISRTGAQPVHQGVSRAVALAAQHYGGARVRLKFGTPVIEAGGRRPEQQFLAYPDAAGARASYKNQQVPLPDRPAGVKIKIYLGVGEAAGGGGRTAVYRCSHYPGRGTLHFPLVTAYMPHRDKFGKSSCVVYGKAGNSVLRPAHQSGAVSGSGIKIRGVIKRKGSARQLVIAPEPHRAGVVILVVGKQVGPGHIHALGGDAHRRVYAGVLEY